VRPRMVRDLCLITGFEIGAACVTSNNLTVVESDRLAKIWPGVILLGVLVA